MGSRWGPFNRGCTIACLKLSGNTPFIKELFMIAKGVGLVVSKASLNRPPGNTSDWQNVNFFWEIILSNWDEDTGCKFVKLLDEWTRWEWSKSKGEMCDLISCTFWTKKIIKLGACFNIGLRTEFMVLKRTLDSLAFFAIKFEKYLDFASLMEFW